MRFASVLLTILAAVFLQVVLARYAVGGTWAFDLVLVGVVFAALQWGPTAGMLAGTLGGLLQDLLAGEIVGLGGLVKTIVGFLAGVVGSQFVLTRATGRALVAAVASICHRFGIVALDALVRQRAPAVSWSGLAIETAINAGCALLIFQVTAALPGVLERQRFNRRSSLSRRQW